MSTDYQNGYRRFMEMIGELAIFNAALSAEEIKTLFQQGQSK